jgi:hypothetical protein
LGRLGTARSEYIKAEQEITSLNDYTRFNIFALLANILPVQSHYLCECVILGVVRHNELRKACLENGNMISHLVVL